MNEASRALALLTLAACGSNAAPPARLAPRAVTRPQIACDEWSGSGAIISDGVWYGFDDACEPSAAAATQPARFGNLSGAVYDCGMGYPLPGARVSIENAVMTAGAGGRFSFARVPVGVVRVSVWYDARVSATKCVTVAPGENEIVVGVDLTKAD